MLRNDNNKLDLDVATMSFQQRATKGRKCRTIAEAEMDYKKEACFHAKSEVKQLQDAQRKNACNVLECMPVKKCRAKVGLHDGNGNFLFDEKLSVGINSRGNVSQALPVYQQRSIIDLDKYFNQLQADESPVKTIVIAEAEHNLQQYRNPTNWDGTPTGYTCFCKPKPKPCPKKNRCKKPDIFNADLGIGSDALQVKSDLAEAFRAESVQVQEYELANREKVLQITQKRIDEEEEAMRGGGGGGGAGRNVGMSLGGLEGRETPSVQDSGTQTMTQTRSVRDSGTQMETRSVQDSGTQMETPLDQIPIAGRRQRMTKADIAEAQRREMATYGRVLETQERINLRRTNKLPRDLRE